MNKRVITVTLNPAVDRTVSIPGFTTGNIFVKGTEKVSAGGKGVNVARALKVLGVPALATGILGGCSGRVTLLKLMRQERINQDFYKFGGYSRTSLNIHNPINHTTTQIVEPGPVTTKKQAEEFLSKYLAKLSTASVVVLSGRLPPGLNMKIYTQLIKLASSQKIPVLLDTHGESLKAGLKVNPWLVTPNRSEAEELVGRKLQSITDYRRALMKLREMGAITVCVTLGEEGAVGFDGLRMFKAVAPRMNAMSTVGCGDAFNAVLVAAHLRRESFDRALKQAVACGCASALTDVPGLFTLTKMKQMYQRIKISNI